MTDELAFPKRPRLVDEAALLRYREEHPWCEVLTCGQVAAKTPHHILQRSLFGADEEGNLLSLCAKCHSQYHALGGHEWYRRWRDALSEGARRKVEWRLGVGSGDG